MRFPDEFFKPSVIAFAMKIGRTTGILIRSCVAGKSTSRRTVGFQVSDFCLNSLFLPFFGIFETFLYLICFSDFFIFSTVCAVL